MEEKESPNGKGIARNTAIFSFATSLSRVAGLAREIVASSYFATSGAFSAFTIAFQLPNLLRSFVADSALSAAFVPVFTELLEKDRKREAFRLASTLAFLILIVLGSICALFILIAPAVMPLFTGGSFTQQLDTLTSGLARVLFPIVVLLGLNGLVVGILHSYEHFTLPAFAPLAWNMVIIICLVLLRPLFEGPNELYAYAIGVLIGTVVQLVMVLPMLSRYGFKFKLPIKVRDPQVKRILLLIMPVTLGLGIVNFDVFINSVIGSLISEQAPRAIDAAFRVYMLPQGIFSVALATVLFPTLSRYAARKDYDGLRSTLANGIRQILLLLIPMAAITVVLAEPITRVIYEHGAFGSDSTKQVSEALFWFSFSLPFTGLNLLLTRAFFSLQKPWIPTAVATGSLLLNVAVSLLLYKPLGIAGPVIATAIGSLVMALFQGWYLRKRLGSLELTRTVKMSFSVVVSSAVLGLVTYSVWYGLNGLFNETLLTQVLSVGCSITAGLLTYTALVWLLRIPEFKQIQALVTSRSKKPL